MHRPLEGPGVQVVNIKNVNPVTGNANVCEGETTGQKPKDMFEKVSL